MFTRPMTRLSTMTVAALTVLALVAATPALAEQKKLRTQTKRVQRVDRADNRRVELERKVTTAKDKPTRNVYDKTVTRTTRVGNGKLQTVTLNKTFTNVDGQRKSVGFDRKVQVKAVPKPQPQTWLVRGDRNDSRGVELQRTITRRNGEQTSNVFDKTVTQTTPVARDRVQTVTLNKTITHSDGQRQSVDFNRTVEVKRNVPQSALRPQVLSNRDDHRPTAAYRPSYDRRDDRDHDNFGFSLGIHIGGDDYYGSLYYGNRCTPYPRYGTGYYERIWVQPVYVLCHDYCGRPYYKLVRSGYYKLVWVPLCRPYPVIGIQPFDCR